MKPHRFVKIVGLCDPRASTVRIECACSHVSEAPSFAAAAKIHDAHECAALATSPPP